MDDFRNMAISYAVLVAVSAQMFDEFTDPRAAQIATLSRETMARILEVVNATEDEFERAYRACIRKEEYDSL